MADTPRVTVPVEPTEGMIEAAESAGMSMAGSDMSSPDMTRHVWSAMLSAAPATEGGAVMKACADFQEAIDYFEADVADAMAEESERADLWDREVTVNIDALKVVMRAALATREEAPAEAVTADSLRSVSDETMRALLSCKDVGSGRAHLASIINTLRAQPPAREDAQPFGYWVTHPVGENPVFIRYGSFVPADDRYTVQPLYTHPAPDALRVAVEALKPFAKAFRGLSSRWEDHETHWQDATSPIAVEDLRRADQALAALQAEQKGGA